MPTAAADQPTAMSTLPPAKSSHSSSHHSTSATGSRTSVSVAEQYDVLVGATTEALVPGTTMLLVARPWFDHWQRWATACIRSSTTASTTAANITTTSNMTSSSTASPSNTLNMPSNMPSNGTSSTTSNVSGPGPIDNASLFVDATVDKEHALYGRLRADLVDNYDYVLLTSDAWQKAVAWYGCVDLPPIERPVIRTGIQQSVSVEVYPIQYSVYSSRSSSSFVATISASRADSIATLKELACRACSLPIDPASVRLRAGPSRAANVLQMTPYDDAPATLLADSPIAYESWLMIEVRDLVTGAWPADMQQQQHPSLRLISTPSPTTAALQSTPGAWPIERHSFSTDRLKRTVGVTGLTNLGNTCFMNSALQCLSNTAPLTEYFLARYYKKEINQSNPLGMHGQMAETYGMLVQRLWAGLDDAVAPRDVKFTIGKFAPQFVGYQQHDSQELTAFLLDGLHEDLNRIIKKPYIEVPDNDGQFTDAQYAQKLWEIHKARNDSIIVDYFQGQYKSTLVCPTCEKVSVTFDPFMYLTLPLPIDKKIRFEFTFVPYDPSKKMVKHSMMMPSSANFHQVCQIVAEKVGSRAEQLQVVDIFQHKIYRTFSEDDMVQEVTRSDVIFIYEVDPSIHVNAPPLKKPRVDEENDTHNTVALSVYMVDEASTMYNNECGIPFKIAASTRMRYQDLYDALLWQLSRFTSTDLSAPPSKYLENNHDMTAETPDGADQWFSIQVRSSDVAKNGSIQVDEEGFVTLQEGLVLCVVFPHVTTRVLAGDFSSSDKIEEAEPEKIVKESVTVDLDDCFNEFSKEEVLSRNEAWFCPRCKEHREATKKLDLWKVPEILVVHMKRFSQFSHHRRKIEDLIHFPLKGLDLTSRLPPQPGNERVVYDLYAISNHFGGLGGGHYTAYAKNRVDGKWYDFDDSRVSPISEDDVHTPAAYMLFYQRRREEGCPVKLPDHLLSCPPSPEPPNGYSLPHHDDGNGIEPLSPSLSPLPLPSRNSPIHTSQDEIPIRSRVSYVDSEWQPFDESDSDGSTGGVVGDRMVTCMDVDDVATEEKENELSGSGMTTRYWDCCAPSCYWSANAATYISSPLIGVFQDGSKTTSQDIASGCDPKDGKPLVFTDPDQQPFSISDQLSYGFAAVNLANSKGFQFCCACFELTFTSGPIVGKKMIVQATNTGSDLKENHFDIMMPGGGVGIFNGCQRQFNAPSDGWGERYGGIKTESECSGLPETLKPGCQWRFGWFQGADNPSVTFRQVGCPEEIVQKSGCRPKNGGDVPESPPANPPPTENAPANSPPTENAPANPPPTENAENTPENSPPTESQAEKPPANPPTTENLSSTDSPTDNSPPSTENSTDGSPPSDENPTDGSPTSDENPVDLKNLTPSADEAERTPKGGAKTHDFEAPECIELGIEAMMNELHVLQEEAGKVVFEFK